MTGWWFQTWKSYFPQHIGSSFPLIFIFFRWVAKNHQPVLGKSHVATRHRQCPSNRMGPWRSFILEATSPNSWVFSICVYIYIIEYNPMIFDDFSWFAILPWHHDIIWYPTTSPAPSNQEPIFESKISRSWCPCSWHLRMVTCIWLLGSDDDPAIWSIYVEMVWHMLKPLNIPTYPNSWEFNTVWLIKTSKCTRNNTLAIDELLISGGTLVH